MLARIEAEDVRAELRIDDVISRYGLKVRRNGSQYRLRECPRCKATSRREAVAIDRETGVWCHHGHERKNGGECSGDLIDLVAACEGTDDFPRTLEVAAKIAGVEAKPITDDERARRREHRERAQADRERQAAREEKQRQDAARLKAPNAWRRLHRRNRNGETYLKTRGLSPLPLIDGGHVMFDLFGNPHVPMWSLADGELVNVACRKICPTEDEPRIPVLPACPTDATICGRLGEIVNGSDVVIVEGVIDTLTAIELWPAAVVLGAHCAGRMMAVAVAAAPIVLAKGGRLLLVPDQDDVGQRCALKAGEAAIDIGLEIDRSLVVVDIGEHADLNDAHRAGWKP